MAENTLVPQVIHLRPACDDDETFLFALFCATREAEFGLLPQPQRETLLNLQYQAQSRDYAARFPHSENSIVEFCRKAAGRLLVNREANEIRVVDIAVLPKLRGKGIGSAVLKLLIAEAEAAGKAVRLSVWHSNPALSLYLRLGFGVRSRSATYLELEWRTES
jgi:ribosomal protein S18 acetylase RimI-like enzyme